MIDFRQNPRRSSHGDRSRTVLAPLDAVVQKATQQLATTAGDEQERILDLVFALLKARGQIREAMEGQR